MTTEVSELLYTEVSDLQVGEFFTLGENCILTFLVRDKFIGRNGRVEVTTTVLAGLSNGRAYDKTMFRPALEVLLVPEEVVGERVSGALEAFHAHNSRGKGRDRVQLGSGIWPHSLAPDDAENISEDDADRIAYADEQVV